MRLKVFLALVVVVAIAGSAWAQAGSPPVPPPQPPGRTGELTSLEVQVVITRLDRGKVVSTLPYTLAVTTNAGEAQLNMGAEVPVPSTTLMPIPPPAAAPTPGVPPASTPGASSAPGRSLSSVNYRPVGTVITCRSVKTEGDPRYQLTLSVDDSTVFTTGQATPPLPVGDALPVFRSFRSRNTLMMTDGQTRQYTAASDRVSGEVVRLEVTLRVVR